MVGIYIAAAKGERKQFSYIVEILSLLAMVLSFIILILQVNFWLTSLSDFR